MLVHFNYDKKQENRAAKHRLWSQKCVSPNLSSTFFLLCLPQFPQKQSGDSNTYFLC